MDENDTARPLEDHISPGATSARDSVDPTSASIEHDINRFQEFKLGDGLLFSREYQHEDRSGFRFGIKLMLQRPRSFISRQSSVHRAGMDSGGGDYRLDSSSRLTCSVLKFAGNVSR